MDFGWLVLWCSQYRLSTVLGHTWSEMYKEETTAVWDAGINLTAHQLCDFFTQHEHTLLGNSKTSLSSLAGECGSLFKNVHVCRVLL